MAEEEKGERSEGQAQVRVPFWKRRVRWQTLLNVVLGLLLLGLLILGYFFLRRQPPAPVEVVAQPVREALNRPPRPVLDIYGPPSSPLRGPMSVATGPDGRIYVADSENNQIQVFDRNGRWLKKWGQLGTREGEFWYPISIVFRNGKVYVAETINSRIQIFDPEGKFLGFIPDPEKYPGLEIGPLALGVDREGNMYVTTFGHDVVVFDRQDQPVARIGRAGVGPGELNYPHGATMDLQGQIWVSDSNGARLHVYDRTGRVLASYGGFVLPRGLAVDSKGRVYVVDTFQHKVLVLNSEGAKLFEFGERGVEEGRFNFPNALWVDEQDRIYVADRANDRISIWQY